MDLPRGRQQPIHAPRRRSYSGVSMVAVLLALLGAVPASADPYSFVSIYSPPPELCCGSQPVSLNNSAVAAFDAAVLVSGHPVGALMSGSGGPVTTLLTGTLGDPGGFFLLYIPIINDSGDVAFWSRTFTESGFLDGLFVRPGSDTR